jgi:phage-related minor tail protein
MNTQQNSNMPSTTLAGFDVIGATIAALQAKFKDVQHDVTTTAGLAAEKKDRAELKGYRMQVEAKRVELKAPYLSAEREIDAHAAKLSSAIGELEKARDKRIKDEEARKAAAKRAIEEAERAERERVAAEKLAEERKAAAEREAALQAERDELAAKLAALQASNPAPVIEDFPIAASFGNRVPEGWDRIEAGEECETATLIHNGESFKRTPNHTSAPAGHDDGLLDLLAASESHSKQDKRRATGFTLPTANEVADALSSRAKRRTTILHVADVLEAIRAICDAR